ncbi:MAG: hypothetical protein ISS74_07640 [Planctomycetes bacterium]|nr:hypothetical protein [Planctomycetota bacterium]
MTNFSTDADLLKWEPALLREIVLDHQCLTRGEDAVCQAFAVTAAEGEFVTRCVRPGHVIHLANAAQGVDGYYEVLSIESETELMAAVVGSAGDDAVPLPAATGLAFAVQTFDPQHEEARYALLARFGLEADAADPSADLADWIAQRRALRRASVALVLAMLYRGQAAGGAGESGLAAKADHYARLYEDEVAKARLVLDRDADGRADDVRTLASHRLRRV